jgi:hypothetical protein
VLPLSSPDSTFPAFQEIRVLTSGSIRAGAIRRKFDRKRKAHAENLANLNRCLGVSPNGGVDDGDQLQVLNCDWGADQQWIFQNASV